MEKVSEMRKNKTRGNAYIMTMVSQKLRQIVGHIVSRNEMSSTIQKMVNTAPKAKQHCTDGYYGHLGVVFPGEHPFNIHNKKDTFTVENINADLRHYVPTLRWRIRCFPKKLEAVFIIA